MRLRSLLSRPRRERRDSLENPSVDLVTALTRADELGPTAAGVSVTPEGSLRIVAVLSAVRILAESVASLPFPVYRREGRSRIRLPDDPRWRVLNDEPNPVMTAYELWETVMAHLLLWGNHYSWISDRGELWPLHPQDVKPVLTRAGEKRYLVRMSDGSESILLDDEVLHIRGLASKGVAGLSPIQLAREALGNTVAAEEFGGRFFANDARPGTVIVWPGQMTAEQEEAFRQRWEAGHRGVKRSHLLGVLSGTGVEIKTIGIPPGDAQFIETRKFGVREIARLFRIPPYMLADLEAGSVSYASVEQQAIDFVVHSLRPWLVRIEQRVKRSLFASESDVRARIYPEFLVEGLLRGDTESRYKAYAIARQWGWLSVNDILELENRPAIPGGDVYLQPLNMVPAGSAGSAQPRDLLERLLPDRDAAENGRVEAGL